MVAPSQELIVRDERIGAEPDSANALRNARDVELRAYYFIYAREFLGRSTNAIRDYVGEQGGIRVYRNGYRVLPYGTSADDWLGLDEAYVRRSVTAPIANRNYLGWVTLTDPSGIIFEETSSREGLIENAAFDEVRRLISSVLVIAAVRIEASRGMGKKPPRPDQDPEKGRRAELEAESAATQLELIITEGERSHARRVGDEASTELQRATAELLNAVRQTAEAARERDEFLEELNFLRILASMGLTIAEFTHDFSHLAETLELTVDALSAAREQPDEMARLIDQLRSQFRLTRAYTSYFGSIMAQNAIRGVCPSRAGACTAVASRSPG